MIPTRLQPRRGDVLGVTLLLAAVIAGMVPVKHHVLFDLRTDYTIHLDYAAEILETHVVRSPHVLFQLLVLAVHAAVPGLSLLWAGLAADIALYAGLVVFVYGLARRITGGEGGRDVMVSVAVALGAILVWPVAALYPIDHHLYFGYLGLNVLHNPTIVLLKPLALALFVGIVSLFPASAGVPIAPWPAAVLALLSVLSALAKPSYTIALLPALGLYLLWRGRDERAARRTLLLAVALPSLAVLSGQYVVRYTTIFPAGDKAELAFAPFEVFGRLSSYLFPKLILSLLFPLTVTLLYKKKTAADVSMVLAWLAFIAGAAFTYLVVEAGQGASGNYAWSGQITLFILFVASMLFLCREMSEGRWGWRAWFSGFVLVLHVLSGILWHVATLRSSHASMYW